MSIRMGVFGNREYNRVPVKEMLSGAIVPSAVLVQQVTWGWALAGPTFGARAQEVLNTTEHPLCMYSVESEWI